MFKWKKEIIVLLFLLAIILWTVDRVNNTQAQVPAGTGVSITIEGEVPSGTPSPTGGGGVSFIPIPATVVFKGYGYPKALVTFTKNGTVIGNALADNDGIFEKRISTDSGISTFGIWAKDQMGFNSSTTNVIIALAEGTKTTINNIILGPTIAVNKNTATQGEKLIIYGSAAPKSNVRLFNNYFPGQILPPVKAEYNGRWEYILDTRELQAGEYSLKANIQLETLGLMSAFSNDLLFTIIKGKTADLNGDGKVDIIDLSIMLFSWKKQVESDNLADINSDGIVELDDFSILMYQWSG